MVTWEECRGDFRPDGSLRDVYVRGGGLPAWEAALRTLLAMGTARYEVDGRTMSLPGSAREALAMRPTQSPLLRVEIGGIDFAYHFFGSEDVELDFAPAEVNAADRFVTLLSVVVAIGEATGCDVIVTSENQRDLAFLRYEAAKKTVGRHAHESRHAR